MATAAIHGATRRRTNANLAHELTLVRSAIDLIASGRASRVTLVSLLAGDELVTRARDLAADRGLAVRSRWHSGREACDLTVEVRP